MLPDAYSFRLCIHFLPTPPVDNNGRTREGWGVVVAVWWGPKSNERQCGVREAFCAPTPFCCTDSSSTALSPHFPLLSFSLSLSLSCRCATNFGFPLFVFSYFFFVSVDRRCFHRIPLSSICLAAPPCSLSLSIHSSKGWGLLTPNHTTNSALTSHTTPPSHPILAPLLGSIANRAALPFAPCGVPSVDPAGTPLPRQRRVMVACSAATRFAYQPQEAGWTVLATL